MATLVAIRDCAPAGYYSSQFFTQALDIIVGSGKGPQDYGRRRHLTLGHNRLNDPGAIFRFDF